MMTSKSAGAGTLQLEGKEIARVDNFKYLNSIMIFSEKDVSVLMGQDKTSLLQDGENLKILSKRTAISLKVNIFQASVLFILIYGCES